MNLVVLQGTLSSEPIERTLASGLNVMSWDVVTETDLGRSSVPVQWNDPSSRVCDLGKGDRVVVIGHVRQRFFRARGQTVARTEVVGAHLAKPTQKAAVSRILERARCALAA